MLKTLSLLSAAPVVAAALVALLFLGNLRLLGVSGGRGDFEAGLFQALGLWFWAWAFGALRSRRGLPQPGSCRGFGVSSSLLRSLFKESLNPTLSYQSLSFGRLPINSILGFTIRTYKKK